MDDKINPRDLILENERLREELHGVTQNRNDLLIYKQQLDAILDNAPFEVCLKDREGRYIRVNKQYEKMFGVKNENLVGMLPADFHNPRLAASSRDDDLAVLNFGKARLGEETAKLVNEKSHTLSTIKFPVFNGDGEVDGLGVIATDISENEATKKNLQKSNILFSQAAQLGKLGHWEWDEIAGRYITCSEQYASIFGMTAEQLIGKVESLEEDHQEFVCEADLERYQQVIHAATKKNQGWDIKYSFYNKVGKRMYLHEICEPVLDDHGVMIKTVGIVQDITETTQLEQELLKSQALFQQAEAIGNMGYWCWDREQDKLISCSDQFAQIFDMTVTEALDHFISTEVLIDLIHPEDKEFYRQEMYNCKEHSKRFNGEYRIFNSIGDTRYIYERSESVFDNNGEPSQLFGTIHDFTEWKQAELALKSSENRLRLAMKVAKQVWFDLNVKTGETLINGETSKPLECDLITHSSNLQMWQDSLHPQDHDTVMAAYQKCLSEASAFSLEYRRSTKDGDWLWFNTTAEIIERSSSQQPLRMVGIHTDITERKQSEDKLLASEQRLSSLVNSQLDLICLLTPDGVLTFVNDSYITFIGNSKSEILGHSIYQYVPPNECEAIRVNFSQLSFEKPRKTHENLMVTAAGERRIIEWIDHGLFDSNQVLIEIQAVGRDVTEIRKYQNDLLLSHKKLEHIAHYDLLTSLPSRVLLADRLSQGIVQCRRLKKSLAVAYLDLDGFKAVNDTYGHDTGDKLLVALSQRMKGTLRESDTLARIGGDEFIAVMVNLDNIKESEPVLKRLLKAAAEPVVVGEVVLQVSASIGVTSYPQDGADADQLIRHADQAMYIAKQAGKNHYHLFDPILDKEIKFQQERINDILSALGKHEFELHYQPKVNMNTGEVIGLEALIRWQHPERGLVFPLEFLPAIEGHVVSLELGEWVIATALTQIIQWQNIGVNLPISVNISAYQLQQVEFTSRLAALLAAHPEVSPHNLELEILETSALSDIDQVFDTMNACHDLGVRFALDDFGTGYSSLTYLRRLPAHMIKIDQSFVRNMLEDADDLAIVYGVVGLAKAFQREVIAEGVETVEHGVALLRLGCKLAQGYGIARPMPAADIPEWVSSWKADDSWLMSTRIEVSLMDL
jgi:diguanylate cyclase (GGDEF)-like protein/PAS domain S-box-containing protein